MNTKNIVLSVLGVCMLFGVASVTRAEDSEPVDAPTEVPVDVSADVPADVPAAETAPNEMVIIRHGAVILYQGTYALPEEGTVDIADSNGVTHSVNARSVLGFLYALDAASDAFSISNIQYYSAYGSLYLKCITPAGGAEACDDWQYAVNGATPQSSMDGAILGGGEAVGVYFGSPHRVVLSTDSVLEGAAFTATAQKYAYVDDTWSPLTGVTIGAAVPNPDDPYSPTIVETQAVDASGIATLTLATAGSYTVGIAEDYYFPSYALTVTKAPQPAVFGGSVYTAAPIPRPVFSVDQALAYLASVQNPDGSFGADLYTDWAAIAVSSTPKGAHIAEQIRKYLSGRATPSVLLTDNERRAMALLALGENPYSFAGYDYIQPILDSFDGTQFGDAALVNDDIFALIPLSHVGYSASDSVIEKDISFVLSKQRTDGSWEGSVDLTAAASIALKPFDSRREVASAIAEASLYLARAQRTDGGFGTLYSTAWAGVAMSALGASWTMNGATIGGYLGERQTPDGAALSASETKQNRIWATSYAVPAALEMSWHSVLGRVPKPEAEIVPVETVVSAPVSSVETKSAPLVAALSERPSLPIAAKPIATVPVQASIPAPESIGLAATAGASEQSFPFSVLIATFAGSFAGFFFARRFAPGK